MILLLAWFAATGLREGCMWTEKWRERLFILDYHGWRTVENLAVYILSVYILGFWVATGLFMFGFCLVYERLLQKIDYDEYFHKQSPYEIMGLVIPIKNWHMITIGIIGMLMLIAKWI